VLDDAIGAIQPCTDVKLEALRNFFEVSLPKGTR